MEKQDLIDALKFVQYALACFRDNEPIIHPEHGELYLEEVKYCVVDPVLEEINPVFEKYLHVAARVEDNILITEDGNEVLSPHLPRTVEDIEKTMRQKSYLNR